MSRVTKQGVRDLNAAGHNGHRNHGSKCRHFFGAGVVVIGAVALLYAKHVAMRADKVIAPAASSSAMPLQKVSVRPA